MPWPVYSTRFMAVGGSVQNASYVVPSGRRAVIKNVQTACWAAAGGVSQVIVQGRTVVLTAFQAMYRTETVLLFVVVYAGETMSVNSNSPDLYTTVSGFLFTDTPAASEDPSYLPVESIDAPSVPAYPADLAAADRR